MGGFSFIRCEQAKIKFKYRVIIQISKWNIVEVKILKRKNFILQFKFFLAKIIQMISELESAFCIVRQMNFQGFNNVISKFIRFKYGEKTKPGPTGYFCV